VPKLFVRRFYAARFGGKHPKGIIAKLGLIYISMF